MRRRRSMAYRSKPTDEAFLAGFLYGAAAVVVLMFVLSRLP